MMRLMRLTRLTRLTRSSPCLLLASILVTSACGGDDDGLDADVILLDEASDEVFLTLTDAEDRNLIETDDAVAITLTSPQDGAALPAASAAAFSWAPPQSTLRHGRATGDFVWCRITCPGTDEPIHVLAIETMTWTPDDDHWAKITSATGACTVSMVSAYVDRGVITEGPYRPSQTTTFSISE